MRAKHLIVGKRKVSQGRLQKKNIAKIPQEEESQK